jgi:hypothetical protein
VHVATISRWITRGIRTTSGVVKLEARRFPSGWRVEDDALDRFLQKLTDASLDDSAVQAIPTSAQRRREIERADRKCEAKGV